MALGRRFDGSRREVAAQSAGRPTLNAAIVRPVVCATIVPPPFPAVRATEPPIAIPCDNGTRQAATGTMSRTTTNLTAAVEGYFADLRRIRRSGGPTGERPLYVPLANLMTAVRATLRPKVFCVQQLAHQSAGDPDFGLYAAKQVLRGEPREGEIPERIVVEVNPPGDDPWATAAGDHAGRYWERYRLLLATNARDFDPSPPHGSARVITWPRESLPSPLSPPQPRRLNQWLASAAGSRPASAS